MFRGNLFEEVKRVFLRQTVSLEGEGIDLSHPLDQTHLLDLAKLNQKILRLEEIRRDTDYLSGMSPDNISEKHETDLSRRINALGELIKCRSLVQSHFLYHCLDKPKKDKEKGNQYPSLL